MPPSALAGSPQCARLAGGGDSRTAAGGTSVQALAPCLIADPRSRVLQRRPLPLQSEHHSPSSHRAVQRPPAREFANTRIVPAPTPEPSYAAGIKSFPAHPRHTSSRPRTRPSPPRARPFSLVNSFAYQPISSFQGAWTDALQEDPSICSLVRSLLTPLSAPRAT